MAQTTPTDRAAEVIRDDVRRLGRLTSEREIAQALTDAGLLVTDDIQAVLDASGDVVEDYEHADDPDYHGEDRSDCPYIRRGLPGADPHGACSYGCWEEPQCDGAVFRLANAVRNLRLLVTLDADAIDRQAAIAEMVADAIADFGP